MLIRLFTLLNPLDQIITVVKKYSDLLHIKVAKPRMVENGDGRIYDGAVNS